MDSLSREGSIAKHGEFNWEIIRPLTVGGQSKILFVRDNNDPRTVYVAKQALKPEFAPAIKHEHDLLKTIVKSGFQHAVDENENDPDGYISYRKFCDGISLSDKLSKVNGHPGFFVMDEGAEDNFLDFAFNLCNLVHYLHVDRQIVHRDINPKNILIGDSISLIDLGIALEINQRGNGEHTPGWAPPEQKIPGTIVNPRQDMYALGRVFLWSLHLKSEKNEGQFVPMEKHPVPTWISRNKAAQDFLDLCIDCVEKREIDRPKIDDLLKILHKAMAAGNRRQRIHEVCPDCGAPTIPGSPVCLECLDPLIYEPPSAMCGVCNREISLNNIKHHYEQAHPDYQIVQSGKKNLMKDLKLVYQCEYCYWATDNESLWKKHQLVCHENDDLKFSDELVLFRNFELVKSPYATDNSRALLACSQAGLRFENLEIYRSLNIKAYDHQEDTVIRALRDLGGRCIIADGVGLGKTIECGIILRELLYRNLISSALIIVPNQDLQGQWMAELEDKFQLGPNDPNGFRLWTHQDAPPEPGQRLVIELRSLDSNKISKATNDAIKPNYISSLGIPKDQLPPKTYHLFINQSIKWDLVIVDEAHEVGIDYTKTRWQRIYMLDPLYLFLVTATPMRKSTTDLYPLIRAISPILAGDPAIFKKDYGSQTSTIQDLHKLKALLSQVMIRHTRNDVHSFSFPRRKAFTYFAPLNDDMKRLYMAIKKLNMAGIRESTQIQDTLEKNAHKLFTRFSHSVFDFARWINHISNQDDGSSELNELEQLMGTIHPATPTGDAILSNWRFISNFCKKIVFDDEEKSSIISKLTLFLNHVVMACQEEEFTFIEKSPGRINKFSIAIRKTDNLPIRIVSLESALFKRIKYLQGLKKLDDFL